ncbi:hypothetical protein U4960_14910 [Altererythrobacter sp. H2]|nr:hypothetical protein [Altererythrobacter sp. H2]WRK95549.1 hypothetical protein U4960_14910 [Altererythrobacter sp. H2]
MAKHVWCWGDIINPDLADRALCADREREARKPPHRPHEPGKPVSDPVAA